MGKNITKMKNFLYWLPRVLGIGLIIFFALFALDAFDIDASIGEMLLGFVIHLIPAFILIIILFIAWKKEFFGGILYVAACAFYIYMTRGMYWMVYLYLGGPLLLCGILFILHYFFYGKNNQHRSNITK